MRVTGVDYEKADAVLNETRNKVKPAIVMIVNQYLLSAPKRY
jgi:N-acetylmuramic acid 6-phosphate (MurNAc-6-P) etherase